MDILGLKFDSDLACGFDLCPLLEAVVYNLLLFG